MTPATKEWLSQKIPDFGNLKEDEINLILDFTLLWSLFEGTHLKANGDVKTIRNYVNILERENKLTNCSIDEYLDYLKTRYYKNGKLTEYFHNLHIERSGNPAEVIEAICDNTAKDKIKFIGCLIIIYRLRNNLFHGVKWEYKFIGEKNNFLNANNFLKSLM